MNALTDHRRHPRVWLTAALAILLTLAIATPALADDGDRGKRIVVSPENMRGWVFAQETPTGTGRMVTGPDAPPAGKGSAELTVDSTGGVILAKAAYQGVFLRDFTRLDYWTYRSQQDVGIFQIALQLQIDRDLTDADESFQGRLVYEPYYSHPTEAMQADVWLHWNTQDNDGVPNGSWWFTRAPQNAPVTGCSQADPCTWTEVLAKFPNVGVHRTFGAVILKAGGGWVGGFVGNTDALTIGCRGRTVLWDFEPSKHGSDKDKDRSKASELCGRADDDDHGDDDHHGGDHHDEADD